MGSGGAALTLLIVFMAVTSALSAELIAVSSVITYDVYISYINTNPSNAQVKVVADITIVAYGLWAGIMAIILHEFGISLGWVYEFMGIVITGAVWPLTCTLMWSKQNWYAVVFSPILATICAIIAWLVCTSVLNDGTVDVDTTFGDYPMLAGNVVALLMPIPISVFFTYLAPDNFDFALLKNGILLVDEEIVVATESDGEIVEVVEKKVIENDMTDEEMEDSADFAQLSSVVLTLVLIIIWPLPLYFGNYVFSTDFFRGWVSFSILWVWCSTAAVVVYPIVENWDSILYVFKGLIADATGAPRSSGVEITTTA